MRETNFNSILVRSFRNIDWHCNKIPDSGIPGGDNRFMTEKPYDIFAVEDAGFCIAIEGKYMKLKNDYRSFSLSSIAEHQIENLVDVNSRIGSFGLIAIYTWLPNKIKQVHFILIDKIISMLDAGEKSLKKEFFINNKLAYNCHKDIFNIPIDFYRILRRESNG